MKESLPLYTDFEKCHSIDPCYYTTYDIKRGLRNADGTGVVVGVTNISNVHGYVVSEGDKVPDRGRLSYRGYSISDLVDHAVAENRFGFEETAYLLMAGELPTAEQLKTFNDLIAAQRDLPDGFTANYIMKPPTRDLMNAMSRAVLQLYAFDDEAENRSSEHEIDTAIMLLSRLPRIMVLSYHVMRDKFFGDSMFIHHYIPGQSTAETILSMLRPDRQFTDTEAKTLDIMLMLHAEHGGGNNSTFTTRVVTSSGADTYSVIAAALSSLKGPKHGGANIKVMQMMDDIRAHVTDPADEAAMHDYLSRIVDRQAFDQKGLIYGMGHAVYSLSDPRAVVFKNFVHQLADAKGRALDFEYYNTIERLAPKVIAEKRHIYKGVSTNVDFYSGFVYDMLGIPVELYTPIFAVARIVGWSAHRMEELVNVDKIIRPAYQSIMTPRDYVPLENR